MWSKKIAQDANAVEDMLKNNVPMKKLGTPDDIANLAVWLSSDVSNFVTGSVFTTDGGQTRS